MGIVHLLTALKLIINLSKKLNYWLKLNEMMINYSHFQNKMFLTMKPASLKKMENSWNNVSMIVCGAPKLCYSWLATPVESNGNTQDQETGTRLDWKWCATTSKRSVKRQIDSANEMMSCSAKIMLTRHYCRVVAFVTFLGA